MPFKDILLVLITYPQATDASEIQEAVSFAVALDARISALACIVQVRAPSQHLMSDAFVGALVASERKKSSNTAAELSAAFEASAKKAGVFQETLTKACFTSDAPDVLIREARLRDLQLSPQFWKAPIIDGTLSRSFLVLGAQFYCYLSGAVLASLLSILS